MDKRTSENLQQICESLQELVNQLQALLVPTRKKKQPPFIILMSDGERIADRNGSNTFVWVIEKLGIERVKALNIVVVKSRQLYLISSDKDPYYTQRPSGEYFIGTNGSSETKIKYLHQIAEGLGLTMQRINQEIPPIYELKPQNHQLAFQIR